MDDQGPLALLQAGSWARNHWRRAHPPELYPINLRGADPCGANVSEANWSLAGLCDTDGRSETLHKADQRRASLCSAKLCDANLWGADTKTTDLENVYWNSDHEDFF